MHFIVVFHVKSFTRLCALEETACISLYSRRDKFFESFIKVLCYSLPAYLSLKVTVVPCRIFAQKLLFFHKFCVFTFYQTSKSRKFMLKIRICDSCIAIVNTIAALHNRLYI